MNVEVVERFPQHFYPQKGCQVAPDIKVKLQRVRVGAGDILEMHKASGSDWMRYDSVALAVHGRYKLFHRQVE